MAFPTFSEIDGETMGKPLLNHWFPISFPFVSHGFPINAHGFPETAKLQIAQGHQASQEMHLAPGDQIVPALFLGPSGWIAGE